MITKREEALWQLLDDIDTATDMYRPKWEAFEQYVYDKCQERHKYLVSDGYTLSEP